MNIASIFLEHAGRGIDKWHHYLAIYERHLARFRCRPVKLLEIGVQRGGSLQMWQEYLGPQADVMGLDIDPACAELGTGHEVIIGNQADPAVLDRVGVMHDVIIDDGSHLGSDQIATFEHLYSKMAPDGVYICEDTHTGYRPDWPRPSFIDFAKARVDDLHAWFRESNGGFASQTDGVHFYDSVVVFERRRRGPPRRSVQK